MNTRYKTLLIYYIILVSPFAFVANVKLNEFVIYYLLIYKTLTDGIFICYFLKKFNWKYFIPIMGYLNNRSLFSSRNKF